LLTQFALSRTTHIPITSVNIVVSRGGARASIAFSSTACRFDANDVIRSARSIPEELMARGDPFDGCSSCLETVIKTGTTEICIFLKHVRCANDESFEAMIVDDHFD
jgi:hypothetical protein